MINPITIKKLENPSIIETSMVIFDESGYSSGAGWAERNIPFGRFEEMFYRDSNFKKQCKIKEYKINERQFSSIEPLFSVDYNQFKFPYLESDGVYVGLESCNSKSTDTELNEKLPNLTFLPNLEAKLKSNQEKVIVIGSTMGHFHPTKLKLQEIYEFEGYGAMVLDYRTKNETTNNDGEIQFVILKPGEKVAVPGNCNMTMYNLQEKPLEMQDFANPRNNEGTKNLQLRLGPIFCVYYSEKKGILNFKLNPLYTQEECMSPNELTIKLEVPSNSEIGPTVAKASQSVSFREEFKNLGINLINANELPKIESIDYNQSLDKIVATNKELLYNILK